MKIAKGPRPWPIHLFAILFILQGVFSLWSGLNTLEFRALTLQAQYPVFDWSRDLVIVWLSAWFTIVLIPVIGVWVFASRLARILVTLMALSTLPTVYRFSTILLSDYPPIWLGQAWVGLAQNGAIILAVLMLYLNSSTRWLRQEKVDYEQVFG